MSPSLWFTIYLVVGGIISFGLLAWIVRRCQGYVTGLDFLVIAVSSCVPIFREIMVLYLGFDALKLTGFGKRRFLEVK